MPDPTYRRHERDRRHLDDLAQLAHRAIDELVNEIRWKKDLAYGPTRGETSGYVTGGGDRRPTEAEAVSRHTVRRKVAQGMRDLRYLVDRKIPEMLGRLEIYDDQPMHSDQDRGADVHGGLSAYRGDRRAPAGRDDLKAALEAQRRRLGRGESHGTA